MEMYTKASICRANNQTENAHMSGNDQEALFLAVAIVAALRYPLAGGDIIERSVLEAVADERVDWDRYRLIMASGLRDGDPIMAARRVLDLPDVFAA